MPATVFDNAALMRNDRVFAPLNIAAYITWAAVVFDALDFDKPGRNRLLAGDASGWLGLLCLIAFIVLFVFGAIGRSGREATRNRNMLLALAQAVCAIAANALLDQGTTIILSIIVAAQLSACARPAVVIAAMTLLNAAFLFEWYQPGKLGIMLLQLLPIIGFQAFAALTAHYAAGAERSRDELLQVNAELLATRALLDESARSEERLRLSRELHDVAGHSLTALKLNLAAARRDPTLKDREDLRVASELADDLLAQIRQVVGALRAHDGLDLRAALAALAAPLPGARIELDVEDGLRVDDVDRAETLLRCAQETITNALRHGRASTIRIALRRRDGAIEFEAGDDGRAPTQIVEGNGLIGMRERLAAIGGTLEIAPTPPRGVRLHARIPERAA